MFEYYVSTAETLINSNASETNEDALKREDSVERKNAMHREIESLKENNTWKLEDLPQRTNTIPCKWVFRLKFNLDWNINKYQARLVTKGLTVDKCLV